MQIPLDLIRDSYTQHKEQPQNVARFSLLYLRQNIKPYTSNWVWAELENFAEKQFVRASIDRV